MKNLLLVFGLLLSTLFIQAQHTDLSFEFQAYPTGLIPGVRIEKAFGDQNAVSLRLGYQHIRHGDWGVHDDERGNGYGFSVGYKRYFKPGLEGWSLGVKNDIWFNELDWEDILDTPVGIERGTSKITVVQPTAELSYLFPIGSSGFFTPSIAFGVEVNVKTEGAEIGQGAILLLGFQFGKRF